MSQRKLFFFLLAAACESKQPKLNLRNVNSPAAKERAAAVRSMDPDDDASWQLLLKSVHDGAAPVRAETAAAMGRSKRPDAPDGLAPLLRDPDDQVRRAAAQALAAHCSDRGNAYLRMAFSRSDAPVRAQIIESLKLCGEPPADTLAKEESEQRRKALKLLEDPVGAQRARGAHELGLLCRDQDIPPLEKLLDDRDGVPVAAAERALGDCGATQDAKKMISLLDEGGEIAAAAAEAIVALHATDQARPQLRKLALADGDEAVPAALALGKDCDTGAQARSLQAAAVMLAGCPQLEQVISRRLRGGERDPLLAELALQYRVAGPALVEALKREQAARPKEERRSREDNDSAAEIAKATPAGKNKYSELMARLQERQAAANARNAASVRFDALLNADDRRDFIAAALRAALQLHAPGAEKIAAAFAKDPDADIAAAARGEPAPPAKKPREAEQMDVRVAIWSDDGAVRAKACGSADSETRKLLAASDPERRVRLACAATNETEPRK